MAKAERPKMGDLIKQLPNVVTPLQEVRPVEPKKPAEEEQVKINGFWAPAALARKMKLHAAETDLSFREINIKALEQYFEKLDN